MAYCLSDAKARFIVADVFFHPVLAEIMSDLHHVEHVIWVGAPADVPSVGKRRTTWNSCWRRGERMKLK